MCGLNMILKALFVPVLLFLTCDCSNILGIIPTPSYSHQIAYINLWKELSLKGHKVTVLTANPQNDPRLTNLTEIDLSIGYQFLEEQHNWYKNIVHNESPIKYVNTMLQLMYEATDIFLNLSEVQQLIHDKSLHFDVVMVEYVFPEFLIFGELFNAPTIMLSSLEVVSSVHKTLQNDFHPVVYPETYIPFVGELSFKERLTSTLMQWVFDYIKSQYLPLRKNNLDKYFGNISMPLKELVEKSSMLFISASPALLYPRPMSPRTIVIGGGTTILEPKQLNKNVQEFLDSAKEGVIYFSLGSNIRSENLDQNAVIGIIEVLKELPYSVLWKFENNGSYKIPENVLTSTWLSQQDVLRHSNVKLFITQGGMQSLEEALYFEKPMVAIPFFGDQFSNTKKLELKGALKVVSSKPSVNPIELRAAIMEVMNNKSYAANIKSLNDFNMDQPMTGMEKAIWWTEYVIRHKGNVDLLIHKPARTVAFYQYYLLDIFAFLIVSLLCVLGLVYLIVLILLRQSLRIFTSRRFDRKKQS